MMTHQESNEVLFMNSHYAGVVTLNRPKSLNALNIPILVNLLPKLLEWEKNKKLVIIKGAGKAFCAGGDIKQVAATGEYANFAKVEYNINNLIGNYSIPYIAFLDGIAMGGGLGVSIHGKCRVATENTKIAMPETKIGLIPDVGGTYFLPRLPFHIGVYLALTSLTLTGKDVQLTGIATHFISSARLPELEKALCQCTTDSDVKAILDKFNETGNQELSIGPHVKDINFCFSASSIDEVLARLNSINDKWSTDTTKAILQMCPTATKVALEAIHRGAQLNLAQCLQMEFRLLKRLAASKNFKEGVRALLIDRDNKPRWTPPTLAEVDEDSVETYFHRLPEDEELQFLNSKL